MTPAVSLAEEALRQLRSDIIAGRIRPNTHLVAGELAERLDISRTPVREALQVLASEGLVVATRRGFVVHEHSAEEIKNIYEVRAALEAMAARLAAERADPGTVRALAAIGAHDPGVVDRPREELVTLNEAFHEAVMVASGNPRLAAVNERNSQHFFNHEIARLYTREEAAAAVAGHAKILEAITKRDPDAAAAAAREHVLEALDVTLRKLR
ncbi:DNA-binding GntR family transcriptional regulator [Catenulispora sp. GAS73]|uniref:GntR family transcriptional regulator n=1 Tax=Catenulispora sp. GAS73 TaxID=3156269 RepID=UPI0035139190